MAGEMRQVRIRELWATERISGRLYNCLQSDTHKRIKIRGIIREIPPGDWLVTPHTPHGATDNQRVVANYEFEAGFIKHDRAPEGGDTQ
jgi:hypothetical protein